MRSVAVTGSASGIGAAVRARLERAGARVVGIDLRDADVLADLATVTGRERAVTEVRRRSAERLDGLVACAGLGPQHADHPAIVSLNYFGAAALLAGLRDALAAGDLPAAVAISSNSAPMPNADGPLVGACLADDESLARRLAGEQGGVAAYAGSKLALARWVRRTAPTAAWAGAGIRLNAVAPGATSTPLLQAGLDDPYFGPAIRGFPIPVGGFGDPDQIAAVVEFLLGPGARFVCGSVVFCDGGTDALLRPDAI
jgi:NAD(P)-dependent dehydrogenase (short-subunit alcohol dehydrogenase family)